MSESINIELLSIAGRSDKMYTAAALSGGADSANLVSICGILNDYSNIALLITSAYALAWIKRWEVVKL